MERRPCSPFASSWPPALWCPEAATERIEVDAVTLVTAVTALGWLGSAVTVAVT